MKLIVFTAEMALFNEEALILEVLNSTVDYLHIRKPFCTEMEICSLISKIDEKYYSKLVLHDYFDLAVKYGLGGIHLNSRNTQVPIGYTGRVSRSCHTIEELTKWIHLDYCTLSPIFDSISKQGYESHFSKEELQNACNRGVIGEKTIALGGINADTIELISKLDFGGVAVLGYLWANATIESIEKRIKELRRGVK